MAWVRCRAGKRAALPKSEHDALCAKEREKHKLRAHIKNAQRSATNRALKEEFVAAYGGRCVSCKETDVVVLTGDHVNNDGNTHVDKHGRRIGSVRLYRWAKDNGWPPSLQLMCMSCNLAKYIKSGLNTFLSRKLRTISHYSPDKSCPCGESDIDKLTLDHVDGGGRAERKALRSSGKQDSLYAIAIKEGFPPRFRVLCMNCNFRAHVEGCSLEQQLQP